MRQSRRPQVMAFAAAVGASGHVDAAIARAAVSGKRGLLVLTAKSEAVGLATTASWRTAASCSVDEIYAERAAPAGQ
jgi:hypothetical protein